MKTRGTLKTKPAFLLSLALLGTPNVAQAEAQPKSQTYKRIKAYLDSVPAIDTHAHLQTFARLSNSVAGGRGMNLARIWASSYFTWGHDVTPWKPPFDAWWSRAKHDFDNARATSFYRYQLPVFQDLYGVDFETMTDAQAKKVDDRVIENYKDDKWLVRVITEKANLELVFNDPRPHQWDFKAAYPWEVFVFTVTKLVWGFHPSEFKDEGDNPYLFARNDGLPLKTFDDYLVLIDRLFSRAKAAGAVCLKSTVAYQRILRFDPVPKERAARVFGRKRDQLTPAELKDFEDFMMWRLAELSAKYELPFQIHTGVAGAHTNPVYLEDFIKENPKTKFSLFHGGYPWIGETAALALGIHWPKNVRNVWIDSNWLPTVSYEVAKRAYHEWLDVVPSDRIMWGTDNGIPEGMYGAAQTMRRCLAEVLAERVDRGILREEYALRIGKQILRDNALKLFPQLEERLWKSKSKTR